MDPLDFFKDLVVSTDKKIIYCVVDGIGGVPIKGKTELEAAKTPNLDALAERSSCGLLTPIYPGITVGSGPGHLALFGYDPFTYKIGRGVLEALGANFSLQHGDLVARINFCTMDSKGIVTDRRAGRIRTEKCKALCEKLARKIKTIDGTKVFVKQVKQYRAIVVFRGKDLGESLNDTDPQEVGFAPLEAVAGDKRSKKSAKIVNEFIKQSKQILKDEHPANMLLLRGFAEHAPIPTIGERYKVKPACIAAYPMYKGISRLLGMEVLNAGSTFESEVECLKKNYDKYDFFYIHLKETDSAGEDGDYERKMRILEDFDKHLKKIIELKPDVIAITGDHSTPAKLKAHSWHPVPALLHAKETGWADNVKKFNEKDCAHGALGHLRSVEFIPLILAHAHKLKKFGA